MSSYFVRETTMRDSHCHFCGREEGHSFAWRNHGQRRASRIASSRDCDGERRGSDYSRFELPPCYWPSCSPRLVSPLSLPLPLLVFCEWNTTVAVHLHFEECDSFSSEIKFFRLINRTESLHKSRNSPNKWGVGKACVYV